MPRNDRQTSLAFAASRETMLPAEIVAFSATRAFKPCLLSSPASMAVAASSRAFGHRCTGPSPLLPSPARNRQAQELEAAPRPPWCGHLELRERSSYEFALASAAVVIMVAGGNVGGR